MIKNFLVVFVLLFFLIGTANALDATLTDLEAYFPFDETSGTLVEDVHNNYEGTTMNNVSTGATGLIGYAVQQPDSDNTNDYTNIEKILANDTTYTINFWFKSTSNTGNIDPGIFYWNNGISDRIYSFIRNNIVYYRINNGPFVFTGYSVNNTDWHMFTIRADGSNLKIFIDGSQVGSVSNIDALDANLFLGVGVDHTFDDGLFDELSYWNVSISNGDINYLYNSGSGLAYPFVDVAFDYTIDKDEEQVILEDTSTTLNSVEITDWNWSVNDVLVSNSQDYNYSTSELTDLNVCLFVDNNTTDVNNTYCQAFNTGDWSPPTTTFSSTQVSGLTDQNITLTCTDNNSGCQYINFRINNGDWNYYSVGDNPLTIIYSDTGDNNIQYFSTDNSDNNESINIDTFTTYGGGTINVYDENSEALLDDVTYTISPAINGDSGGTLTDSNTLDLNLQGITNTEYTFTFSKTGYGTRYYQTDLNQFSDIDINFALLPNSLGTNIEFQIYDTDQTTLITNTYIEFFNWNKNNWTIGQRKTDSTGKQTFFINPNDANYTLSPQGYTDYNAMTLTVAKPKDETTGETITGNWDLTVGGLAWQNYTDITNNQDIQIYANTAEDYQLNIVDDNSDYFERKYFVSYLNGTTAETLQPYLVPVADAVSTTIYTISTYTQQPVSNISIKIYKTIAGPGKVLVEQVTTDSKGETLISLIANATYDFELYQNEELIGSQSYSVTATSTTIYISIDNLSITTPTIETGLVNVSYSPKRTYLINSDTSLTQTISINDQNLGLTYTSAFIYITNTDVNGVNGNDVNIYSTTITSLTNSIDLNTTAQTINGISYDTNGVLTVYVEVTTNQGVYYSKYTYKPPTSSFNWHKAVGLDLRSFAGCLSTNDPLIPCPTLLFAALFISIIFTIAFGIETGFTGQEALAGMFLVIMGVFTYLTWVPIGLMALLAISVIMLMIAIGGRGRI